MIDFRAGSSGSIRRPGLPLQVRGRRGGDHQFAKPSPQELSEVRRHHMNIKSCLNLRNFRLYVHLFQAPNLYWTLKIDTVQNQFGLVHNNLDRSKIVLDL